MTGRTSQNQIERFAESIDAKLRSDEESTTSMKAFTRSKLREVLRRCGYKKRSAQNLRRIEEALLSRGVFPDPPLTTQGLDREHQIHFTRSPQSERVNEHRVGFRREYDLESFLIDNFAYLFPGMRFRGRQYAVQSGKVDILATDRDGYVVIELKKGRPTERLVSQVIRYMDDVAAWVGDSVNVRGLVVSEHLDQSMRGMLADLAASRGRRIDWMEYHVDLVLRPVRAGVNEE